MKQVPNLTLPRLQNAVLRPSDQMSIKEIDLAKLEDCLVNDPESWGLVLHFAGTITRDTSSEANQETEVIVSIIESRRRVMREISLRRGRLQFRARLIRRYGCVCQISGCAFPALIEAAHIRPYAQTNENSVHNGLLLRGDLHTAFDLGFLAINPKSRRVKMHPALIDAGYASFEGTELFVNGTDGPDPTALSDRWRFFQSNLLVF